MKLRWITCLVFSAIAGFTCLPASAAGDQVTATAPAAQASGSAEQAKQAGEAFLEQNKNKKGVYTTPSGLQYQVLDAGNGKKPGKNDTVTVDYEGRLLNGQVFDSSYQRGQPASFNVSQVIEGWTEALQMMNTGATWMLFIPAKLAYGPEGAGGVIGPNEVLVFKVHLISVK